MEEFDVSINRARLGIQSAEPRVPTAEYWAVAFKVPSTDVKSEEAGYRWVSNFQGWRGELARENEEVFVEHESVFDKRGPAEQFNYGVIQ